MMIDRVSIALSSPCNATSFRTFCSTSYASPPLLPRRRRYIPSCPPRVVPAAAPTLRQGTNESVSSRCSKLRCSAELDGREAGGGGVTSRAQQPFIPPLKTSSSSSKPQNKSKPLMNSGERLRLLQGTVDDLGQLIRAQHGMLQQQQQTIEQLKAAAAAAATNKTSASASLSSSFSLQRPSNNSSFESSSSRSRAQVLGTPPEAPSDSPSGSESKTPSDGPEVPQSSWPQDAAARSSRMIGGGGRNTRPFDSQRIGIGDRRLMGLFESNGDSTGMGEEPKDFRVLPDRIFLVRHAESHGNVDHATYSTVPDSKVTLTAQGQAQAQRAGMAMRQYLEEQGGAPDYKLFFYTSPYQRSLQTCESMSACFPAANVRGVQEEVQLREQDFGNFQDANGKLHEKAERLRFGRFFYRFPNGESGADVYDRVTIFEDHMIRDINAGRFADKTNLVLVTHGLALRIFLMRWFHWTLDQYLMVHNPPNAEPLVLERITDGVDSPSGSGLAWRHTKALYRLSADSMKMLRGCTPDMCKIAMMHHSSDEGDGGFNVSRSHSM